ncbi:MAG: hypothetical protein ACLQVI_37620 [Polyangiaceae bacterium]
MEVSPTEAWRRYFEENRDRPSPPVGSMAELDAPLRAALVRSLGRFYLGESSEGRIAKEAAQSCDPALDGAMRESIGLYIREEGRHAREIASALRALGAPLPTRHWSESLFRRGRRLLGLRTKMMVIGAAEVVGVVYYGLLAERIPPLAAMARTIARDEEKHLEFQAEYFARVLRGSGVAGVAGCALAAAGFATIVSCAVTTFAVDHAPLLAQLSVSRVEIARRCTAVAERAAEACAEKRAGARGAWTTWASGAILAVASGVGSYRPSRSTARQVLSGECEP